MRSTPGGPTASPGLRCNAPLADEQILTWYDAVSGQPAAQATAVDRSPYDRQAKPGNRGLGRGRLPHTLTRGERCEDRVMQRANVYEADFEFDPDDPPGYRGGVMRLTQALGAQELAVNVFEIPPGESQGPYHYEYVEEWLLMLEGELVLRLPDGEHRLGRGDIVTFPAGAEGAHTVTNRGSKAARIMMFSSGRTPAVAVYPDSDKIAVWPGNDADNVMMRRGEAHLDYYDGEV